MTKVKCKPKCSSNESEAVASLENTISELVSQMESLSDKVKFLECGHPILLIQNQKDIDSFDFSNGKGSSCWEGWAICNGGTHYSARHKANVSTPNFTDRFIVQAGGSYAVNATGGANTVSLTVAQMPSHNHAVTDPGHTHVINDPGHDHGVTDPGHQHSGSMTPHVHTFTTDISGNHNHLTPAMPISVGSGDAAVAHDNATNGNTSTNGAHQHTGTTDPAGGSVTTTDSFTGIDINNAFTGVSANTSTTGISTQNQGNGDAHENRPPYYAAVYVMYIG